MQFGFSFFGLSIVLGLAMMQELPGFSEASHNAENVQVDFRSSISVTGALLAPAFQRNPDFEDCCGNEPSYVVSSSSSCSGASDSEEDSLQLEPSSRVEVHLDGAVAIASEIEQDFGCARYVPPELFEILYSQINFAYKWAHQCNAERLYGLMSQITSAKSVIEIKLSPFLKHVAQACKAKEQLAGFLPSLLRGISGRLKRVLELAVNAGLNLEISRAGELLGTALCNGKAKKRASVTLHVAVTNNFNRCIELLDRVILMAIDGSYGKMSQDEICAGNSKKTLVDPMDALHWGREMLAEVIGTVETFCGSCLDLCAAFGNEAIDETVLKAMSSVAVKICQFGIDLCSPLFLMKKVPKEVVQEADQFVSELAELCMLCFKTAEQIGRDSTPGCVPEDWSVSRLNGNLLLLCGENPTLWGVIDKMHSEIMYKLNEMADLIFYIAAQKQ